MTLIRIDVTKNNTADNWKMTFNLIIMYFVCWISISIYIYTHSLLMILIEVIFIAILLCCSHNSNIQLDFNEKQKLCNDSKWYDEKENENNTRMHFKWTFIGRFFGIFFSLFLFHIDNHLFQEKHDMAMRVENNLLVYRFKETPFAVNFLLPSHALDKKI